MKQTIQISVIAAVFAVVGLSACGPSLPPTMSPEAKVAVRGDQLVQALRATLPQIKANTCQPANPSKVVCIKAEDTVKVAATMGKAADVAIDLSKVLAEVDAATSVEEKTTKLDRARGMLASIQKLLMESVTLPVDASGREALNGILSTVTTVLFAVL